MIIIENLNKSYNGRKILDNFSLEISRGETVCVMAPSGMGKTTLLRIMMGLEQADSGRIEGISGLRMSAVFQEDRLCENLDAVSNIRLVNGELSKERIMEVLASFGLSECCGQRVSELSGGMKRRVAIIRALLAEYDIMFMDEPFKGLDVETRAAVIGEVTKLSKGKTIIFVTHDQSEIELMHTQKVVNL
jgi:NitT/TauT family transport system ATP-binding protein